MKPSAPVPARTPPSLPGDASRSPVAGVALPLARGSAFLAADTQISKNDDLSLGVCGLTAQKINLIIPKSYAIFMVLELEALEPRQLS